MGSYHLYAFRIGHTAYMDIDDDWVARRIFEIIEALWDAANALRRW